MTNTIKTNKAVTDRFEFRDIRQEEADQAVAIEQICFPPHEACSEKHMKARIAKVPELFLVAIDKETEKIAGFLNGISTKETVFRDEFFTDENLYDAEGTHVMLLGLDVLPEYRMQGLATEIVYQYALRESPKGRKALVLTCLDSRIEMYKKMGFQDNGIANSTWGGEEWHEMSCVINNTNRIFFIYNPKAGKGKIKNNLLDIVDVFTKEDYYVTAYPTQAPGDATEQVKTIEKGFYDMIVCSGGDGTLDEVVAGMMQREEKLPIGYIPAGSTNDFAKSLGISDHMPQAAKDIVEGKVFRCDVGDFNRKSFVYVAAFGLFTEVTYETDQQLKNILGHTAYVLEGVKSLSSIKSYKMQIESEEGILEGDFIYGMITNSLSVGGFKNITSKDTVLDDGIFEVMLIERPTNVTDLNNIVVSLVTQNYDASAIHVLKTSYLKIKSENEVKWTLDGEFGGSHTEVELYNRQKAISIIVKENELTQEIL